jgi:hypothetical protein
MMTKCMKANAMVVLMILGPVLELEKILGLAVAPGQVE